MRRVRTAMPRPLEFWRAFDWIWAAAVALAGGTAVMGGAALEGVGGAWLAGGVAFVALFLVTWIVLWMGLVNCNPYRPGYRRFDSLRDLGPWAIETELVTRESDLSTLAYPRVFKPALCSSNSSHVRLVRSEQEARAYLDASVEAEVLSQRLHLGEEYTIMWERWPWRPRGAVVDVFWRKKTHPPGEFHPLSGAGTPKTTVPAGHLLTPALVAAVEDACSRIPGLYCTRLDVRADGDDAMARGVFSVLESNGTIGVSGRGLVYAAFVHWPRRMLTGLYNMTTHPNATARPSILVDRTRRFLELGGWDYRFCDGY